ncbi:hypothetical protein [Nonomuraea basaltis]|uniref:hypothetical protein n=1 Tax=Nonomuraea basaltis TaxID=2495887 RepID=UPI00110C4C81|nr:hypothetical protein [Nonomuraea basaltis]TMR95454.1 hypothetical protein EJK15_28520 [Nonomuraea basaltis]
MSLTTALWIVTWAALILLYLALLRVFHELRTLRAELASSRLNTAGQQPIDLPGWQEPEARVVLAVDSTCPACWATVEETTPLSGATKIILLTHEPAATWAAVQDKFDVREDTAAWTALAHLSAPIVLLVGPSGRVEEVVLPAKQGDAQEAILRWTAMKGDDRDAELV